MAEERDLGILQTVRGLHSRDPFIPFRIVMNSGNAHIVEDSELLAIGASQLVYCVPHSDRVIYLRLSQISLIEDLGEAVSRKRRTK